MPLCKLCLTNEANQTGSHIVSAFYIKPVIGGRGREESYSISDNPYQKYTEDKKDEFVKEDYILCTSCEKRLGYVETYVSEELSGKFRKVNFSQNFLETKIRFRNRLTLIEATRVNPFAYQIFIYSVIWRASISQSSISEGFFLTPEIEESIRTILHSTIPPTTDYRGVLLDKRTWFSTLAQDHVSQFIYPFLVVSPQSSEPSGAGFISFVQGVSQPYSIIIGDSIIYFNCNYEHLEDEFRLLHRLNKAPFYNHAANPVRILIVSDSLWAQTRKRIIQKIVRARAYNFYKNFEAHLIMKLGELPKGYKHLGRAAYSLHVDKNKYVPD